MIYCGLSSSAGVTPMSETLLCKRMTQIPTETVKDCGSLLKDALNALSENKAPKLPGNNLIDLLFWRQKHQNKFHQWFYKY